ncbi:MAG: PQQ-binding-like beta-propeller repeat protein [Verrucomicrobia bacterium]|nr:PQQ-binding-like beta-propeller repeat protein [Verrucomicrobiota bacterium]
MKNRSFLSFLFLAVSAASAGDWPRFRGPSADGRVTETQVPLRWSATENIAWKTDLPGPGSSSPIVSAGRVFVTCWSGYGLNREQPGEMTALKRHALCLDRRDGRILWNIPVPDPAPDTPYQGPYLPQHGYASSTPVSDGTNVFFFLGKSGVFAFTRDGKKLWQANVGTNHHDWGTGASPILYKDLVIVNAAMESDTLFALRKNTGQVVWKVSGLARAWNTPALVNAGGAEPELVVALQGRLRAFNPSTGQELWNCRAIAAAELCPSIVAHQGVIYLLGHPAGQAMAVRAGGHGDVTTTHVVWRLNKGSNVSSPVYHDGHLYFANDSRAVLYCVKAASGEVVWEQPLQPKPDKIYASPVLVGNQLCFVTRNRGAFIVAAQPEFKLLANNPPLDASAFNGSPAVSDGQMFLRSERAVYCLGKK